MKKKLLILSPVVALGLVALSAGPAMADHASGSYSAPLGQVNNSGASGEVWIDVEGSTATVTLTASGLAESFMDAPYPHVQHIHIGAQGICPTPEADTNGDGIISTTEGGPFYGEIGTTLSTGDAGKNADAGLDLTIAPSGSTIDYEETFELNQATQDALASGTGVVVVHGLDPAGQPESGTSPSDLVPSLPLAATSPALCGELALQPAGGAGTGVVTQVADNGASSAGMLALGGLAVVAAGGAFALGRRTKTAR
jgi:hypothetical protein